ncbi:hypothetical protein ACYX8G_00635 [Microbacterium saperdae]
MPRLRSAHRRPLAVCFIALSAVGILGCSPVPEPEPSPTPAFASEEEAFAAAEETYRAYNDAGNARRAGADSPDPQDYLIGDALEGDIDAMNYLQSQEIRVVGTTKVISFATGDATISGAEVNLNALVCIDVSATRVLDPAGTDVTPPERQDQLGMRIAMTSLNGKLRIAEELSLGTAGC